MSASRRLTPRLIFQVDLENKWNREIIVLVITGEMYLKKNGGFYGLATLNPFLTETSIELGRRSSFSLELDLNFRQLEIIEKERRGGDVHFRLRLKLLWMERKRTSDRFIRDSSVVVIMPRWGQELRIPQSEWVKMLGEIGYERLRVIELPIPEPPKGTVIDSSLQHIEEALRSYNEGDYDDVLGNCRKAIYEVEKAKLDLAKVLDSNSKAEKMDGIQRRLKDFLSLGPHAETRDYINRRDAEAALYFTTSLIRYLAKQLMKASKEG